jgi:DNA-binding Lrp family transcriptional regulator
MAARGYILIEVIPGKVEEAATALRAAEGVVHCDVVTGPYDIIVTVEAPDLEAIGSIVKRGVQGIDGIEHTLTCLRVG